MNNLVANSTPQTSSRNEKRSSSEQRVSFEDGTEEINFVENLSQNHKDDLWFTEVELRTFKRQAPRLRRASNANSNINTVHQRREIRRVVLSQHRQRHAGIVKPERIANISEAASVCLESRRELWPWNTAPFSI